MRDNLDRYRRFSESTETLPIFLRAWWLDATCGRDGWGVALVERDAQIIGALPYRHRRRFGLTMLEQPKFTQFLGPWISQGVGGDASLARQKDIMEALIAGLPSYARYAQSWSPDVGNWLPFYWAGFSQTTRYTMKITDLTDLNTVWSGFQANARTDVRKAQGRFEVRLRAAPSLTEFLALSRLTFMRQNKVPPYSTDEVTRLDRACQDHACSKILIAEDQHGRAHAGMYLVWDSQCLYYLMGGGDPQLRNSGATSFCVWEAIRFAATVSKSFDFEGSMLEPVERFFRSFGARQAPYFHVSRTPSPLLRWRSALMSLR